MRMLFLPGYKVFVSRANYNDLMDTTMQRMTEMLGRLPKGTLLDRDKSPPMKWWIRPAEVTNTDLSAPGDTEMKISQCTFMGLMDDLGSIEAHGWVVDEAHEVEEKRAREILSRLRAPGLDREDRMALFAFNPPDKAHWLYTACTGRNYKDQKVDEPWMALYEPVPKENIHNLPDGYYEDLEKTLTPDQADRLVHGRWGSIFPGTPVFKEFKASVHVKRNLHKKKDHTRPILRFWDFGYRHPACIWAQLDWEGRLLHFRELLGENQDAIEFGQLVLSQSQLYFPHHKDQGFIDYGDPAVTQMKDTGQTLAQLAEIGIHMKYRTSKIEQGVNLMHRLFNQMAVGEPIIQYDEAGCPILISALAGGYHLDDRGQKPVKDGFYDHVVDANRYGIVNLFLGGASPSPVTGSQYHENLPTSMSYVPKADPRRGRRYR